MDEIRARKLGKYIQAQRRNARLSGRGLCALADVDIATLVRLEQGKIKHPRLSTLTALADALDLPRSDIFDMAGYSVPFDLPSLPAFLRNKYAALPEVAVADIEDYFQETMRRHGVDPNGPAPGEDEAA